MTNILLDTFNVVINFAGAVNARITQKLYGITGLDDPYIIIGISTAFIIVPIVWFLITNFTETMDYRKLAGIVLALSVLTIRENRENLEFTVYLDEVARTSGVIGLIASVGLSGLMIMQDPYYQGLFGRFRDND